MHIFHTTSGFKRPNISRNTRWNCNFSLPFKNSPPKLHVIQIPLQKLGRNSLYYVLNISYFNLFYFEHLRSTVYESWSCSGLKTCTFGLTKKLPCKQFHLQKTIELYCDLLEAFLFQMNRDNSGNSINLILVDKYPLSYQIIETKK